MKNLILLIFLGVALLSACKNNIDSPPRLMITESSVQPGGTSEFSWSEVTSLSDPFLRKVIKGYITHGSTFYKNSTLDIISTSIIFNADDTKFISPISGFMKLHIANVAAPGTYQLSVSAGDTVEYNHSGSYYTNRAGKVTVIVNSIDTVKKVIGCTFSANLFNPAGNSKVTIDNGKITTTY